jgi:nitrite reductase/ring-hydroxylating ferredoxin subunit
VSEFVAVADDAALGEGQMMGVEVAGRRVLLARVGGELFAISDLCTHEEGYLHEGELEGAEVVCPIHFAKFDLRTGAVTEPPADVPAKVYDVKVEAGKIMVSARPRGA